VAFFFFIPAHLAQAFKWPAPEIIETSDIVFIPGIQASRLYQPGIIFENRLWEPNRNGDVEKLLLTDEGKSIQPNIYTRDVIDESYGFNVYKNFLSFLNSLKQDLIIEHYTIIPYDWRYDAKQILADGIKINTVQRLNILNTIRGAAQISPSRKVTLITHSNGALLAKEIINQLGPEEARSIIDQVIMVAPPQLGTPKAITTLLHGDDQDLMQGLLVHKDTARELGEDMKSAYALLPSAEYFNRVNTDEQPLVEFDPSVDVMGWGNLRQQYENAINSYDELKSFLTGEYGVRTEPAAQDVVTPNVLKTGFLNEAETAHGTWDAWQPPEGVKVTQIVGWGLDTIRGVRYFANTSYACPSSGTPCTPFSILDHEPLFTKDGDRTVVTPSADNMNVEIYYMNLFAHNRLFQFNRNREHKDMMELDALHELFTSLFQKKEFFDLPKDVSFTKPNGTKNLIVRVHSPIKIDLYDSYGNHTGVIPNPSPTSDIPLVEQKIPNSSYYEIGEGKYVTLDTQDTYQLKLEGTAIGTFDLKIEQTQDDQLVDLATFKDVPVTPNTKATLTTQTVATTSQLSLDIEGDGKVDMTVGKNQVLSPADNISILEKIIQASSMPKSLKVPIIAELEATKKLVQGKNNLAAKAILSAVILELKNTKNIGLTQEQVVQLVYMVDQIKNSLK